MEIKEIDLNELEISDLSNNLDNYLDDKDIEKIMNVVYSYPYNYKDNLEYQFRLSFVDDDIVLDEVIYNEDEKDIDKCILEEKNILKKPIKNMIDLMKQNIDIRDEKTLLKNEVIVLNDENIDENKKVVLKELYSNILESLLD